MSTNERHGLVKTLAGGLKDVPRNASWLVGKAFTPHDGTHPTNGTGVADRLSHAGPRWPS